MATKAELRLALLEALDEASVHRMRDAVLKAAFLDGSRDVRLDELELDSLSTMELCIAVELKTGVDIVPDRLLRFGTLERIVDFVHRRA